MTHSLSSHSRRGTPLWRSATVLYTIGAIDFVVAFAMLFPAYFLSSDFLTVTALYMVLGAWPVLFVAAVLDVLRHR